MPKRQCHLPPAAGIFGLDAAGEQALRDDLAPVPAAPRRAPDDPGPRNEDGKGNEDGEPAR